MGLPLKVRGERRITLLSPKKIMNFKFNKHYNNVQFLLWNNKFYFIFIFISILIKIYFNQLLYIIIIKTLIMYI